MPTTMEYMQMLSMLDQMDSRKQQRGQAEWDQKYKEDALARQLEAAQKAGSAYKNAQNPLTPAYEQAFANMQNEAEGPLPESVYNLRPKVSQEDRIKAALDASLGSANPEGLDYANTLGTILNQSMNADDRRAGIGGTDTANYISARRKAYKEENGGREMPASEVADEYLNYKRSQLEEIVRNRTGEKQVDLKFDPRIAFEVAMSEAEAEGLTAAEIAEVKETAKLVSGKNVELYESAMSAEENIVKANQLLAELESGGQLTGMGAELFKNLQRVAAMVGSEQAAGTVIKTEYLDVLMGQEIFPLIQALGIGARGLDTPAEREFLRKVMTGEITLNRGTLIQMTKNRIAAAQRKQESYNKRVEDGSLDRFFKASGIKKQKLGEPVNYGDMTLEELLKRGD